MIGWVVLGIIIGIGVDFILFQIWHYFAHKKMSRIKEEIKKHGTRLYRGKPRIDKSWKSN